MTSRSDLPINSRDVEHFVKAAKTITETLPRISNALGRIADQLEAALTDHPTQVTTTTTRPGSPAAEHPIPATAAAAGGP